MNDIHTFLTAITIVLCVAAVTTVVFQRLRQPVVIGYIMAGLLVGPHVPFPLVADTDIIRTLSELGVILLMFSLGLEFSVRRVIEVSSTSGIIALLETSVMIWIGFMIGQALGWTSMESLFAGMIIAISSTTIIAKVFAEQNIAGRLKEIVVGVLIVEDLIGILFMAVITGIATGTGLGPWPMMVAVGKLTGFLFGIVIVGMFIVPRMMNALKRINRKETTLVASIGFCFVVSLIAREFGYAVALGAFLAGSLIAESGEEKTIEHLIEPVRDMFAAIFFVSVGMLIDPKIIAEYLPVILLFTAVVIAGKIFAVSFGTFLTGNTLRMSVKTGMSMAQIGEFSFIIAGLGVSLQATGEFLYSIAVTISALTTLATPVWVRSSGPVANWFDRKLPRPLQTFTVLYGSWIDALRIRLGRRWSSLPVQRFLRMMFLDASILSLIIIGTSVKIEEMVLSIAQSTLLSETLIRWCIIMIAVGVSLPFCVGIIRVGKKFGLFLARMALPLEKEGKVDFVAAPRRMLVVTLQLANILLIGIPLLAVTQPFLPPLPSATLAFIILGTLAVNFWRSANDLQGHVRAGAEVVAEALHITPKKKRSIKNEHETRLNEIHHLLPGLGDLISVKLEKDHTSVGRTLAELNLRGVTGATVLAIIRKDTEVIIPSATERLREGDVIAMSGTHEAIAYAREYLYDAQNRDTSRSVTSGESGSES